MNHLQTTVEVNDAAHRLSAGALVAIPTETVYGLAADASNPSAVANIYVAKGRPADHPLIVHVAPEGRLHDWARVVPECARALTDAFWPGPLTLILPRQAWVPALVCGGQDTIGLRCPAHPVAQAVLRAFAVEKTGQLDGCAGLAAPSANKFGQVSPTLAAHVRAEFPMPADPMVWVVEGGASEVGIESTILDLSRLDSIGPVLLRPGHITAEQLAVVLGQMPLAPDAAAPRASGTLAAHYAPRTPLRLMAWGDLFRYVQEHVDESLAVLSFSSRPEALRANVHWMLAPMVAQEYAAILYGALRDLDGLHAAKILVEIPPDASQWVAVRDRLSRAAAAFI
jgi:L-threonylcarbamoyladenylate synthase